MKNLYKRIITVFLAVVTLFFSCVPCAYASGWEVLLSVPGDFWDWAVSSYYSSTENPFLSLFDKSVCPHCPDVTRRHNFKEQRTTVDGKTGLFYICEYCGKSAGEVGEEAYQQQVSDLPATGITSAGKLIWQATLANCYRCGVGFDGARTQYDVDLSSVALSAVSCSRLCSFSYSRSISTLYFEVYVRDLPVSGTYKRCSAPLVSARYVKDDASIFSWTYSYPEASAEHRDVSDSLSSWFYWQSGFSDLFTSASFLFYMPVYEVIPDSAIDFANDTQYNVNTRPTTITGGNYGIVGDDNQITTVNDNRKIVNEGDNIYYNPATGQTQNITDWSYDYSSRIYNITLDTGDKVSVEYGDENISIVENKVVEGDTIVNNYTIYYMIDGSGDNPDPTPGPTATTCPHSWQEVSRTEPTCTSPGSVFFSCEKCGEAKTDKLPATGHTWQVLRTVQTAYDEEGNLVQQGYTIYQCAVCSEQYKDTEGTGPPGGGDEDNDKETIWDKIANFFGSIVDGIAGIFEAVLGKLLDALTALSELLMGKIKDVVEVVLSIFDELPQLFDGFLNFLGLVFPFLPPEITLLLTFGVIAVVFIGIIKAIRR